MSDSDLVIDASEETQEVQLTYLNEDQLPLVIVPNRPGISAAKWALDHLDFINRRLVRDGGILFRGFDTQTIEDFQELVNATCEGDTLAYTNRSTPRSEVENKVYTSTEYPPDQWIPQHNENAYTQSWPRKIWFYCKTKSEKGGNTPICDSRKVYENIDPSLRRIFENSGIMYVRNYGKFDLTWQEVFQTESKEEVEKICDQNDIQFEWKPSGDLRTRQVCQATISHPETGEKVWFNQAHLFHNSSLDPIIRDALIGAMPEEDLPRNTYFGNGAPIDDAILDEIRAIYDQELITFDWEEGDILLLDNILTTHGREPFQGDRKVLVAMGEPQHLVDYQQSEA